MNSLFLDTSNHICIGLLSEDFEWIEFKIIKEKKASKALHGLIQDLLTTHRLELDEIKNIFYISGPGSYTGVRVAHGLCEVLQWQSFDVYSCRHFDIPKLLGVSKGSFASKAFKREIFLYNWNEGQADQSLIPEDKLDTSSKEFYTCDVDSFPNFHSTYKLIEHHSQKLFSLMLENSLKSEVFYYRSLDEEFTKSKS